MMSQPQHSKQPNAPIRLAPFRLRAARATAPLVLTSQDADVSPLGVLDDRGR